MWARVEEEGEEERSAREVAMRDGTRRENATRLCGAIEMDVNEDSVAPWNNRGVPDIDVDVDAGGGLDDDGCAEDEVGEVRVRFGMKDVTTATGWAVSRRSARIFWESSGALVLLARSEEDQRFGVASASAASETERDMAERVGHKAEMCFSECLYLL
jgi:hypothetical protein